MGGLEPTRVRRVSPASITRLWEKIAWLRSVMASSPSSRSWCWSCGTGDLLEQSPPPTSHTVGRVDGLILWANSHLLFWLSLIPAATAWMGENLPAPLPTAVYGAVLLMPAIAYYLLQKAITHKHGTHSVLAQAYRKSAAGNLTWKASARPRSGTSVIDPQGQVIAGGRFVGSRDFCGFPCQCHEDRHVQHQQHQ
jgi:hypothetical protein